MDPMDFSSESQVDVVDEYMTVAEIARRLRCATTTIYAAIEAGEITGVLRIGSRRGLRVPRASYEAYRRSLLVSAAPVAPAAATLAA
jgi:excisionase family DNA binding protein